MEGPVVIAGAVAIWMLSRWVTKAERARADLRDLKGKVPLVRAELGGLAVKTAAGAVVLALIVAAARHGG